MNIKQQLTRRRDQLLMEANQSGGWNANRYEEVQDIIKRIALIPDDPVPDKTPRRKPDKKAR